MAPPTFVIPLVDLEKGPKTAQFEIAEDWLRHALQGTEASPGAHAGSLDVELSKNGSDVLVRGKARVDVVLPCARTLDPAPYTVEPDIFLLLSPASSPVAEARPRGRSRRDERHSPPGKSATAAKTPTKTRGKRPKAGGNSPNGWENDPVLSEDQAARDTYQGEQIALDDFVREFILLELPLFPLREDLRSESFEAIAPPPEQAGVVEKRAPEKALDPRLAPLAALKDRLRKKE